MMTVLFVAAALTVMGTTAAFISIREFQSNKDDRGAAEALSYAEAGIDRMTAYISGNQADWADIRYAGCTVAGTTYPPVKTPGGVSGGSATVGTGTFDIQMTVFNPQATGSNRFPPAACAGRSASPKLAQYFAITSTGRRSGSTRVVRQVVSIRENGLPIGIYADSVTVDGNPRVETISLFSKGDVGTQREQLGFRGVDKYYTESDFWPTLSATSFARAAVHALGKITFNNTTIEHKATPLGSGGTLNCGANAEGDLGQSQWDQSGVTGGDIPTGTPACTGQPAPPPSSLMTQGILDTVAKKLILSEQDYAALRDAAKANGIYCRWPTSGSATCTKKGVALTVPNLAAGGQFETSPELTGLPNHAIVYLDNEKVSTPITVEWWAGWPEPDACLDPDPTNANKDILLIVRQGNLNFNQDLNLRGAVLVPEGTVSDTAHNFLIGTFIAKKFQFNGNGTYKIDSCWLANIPGAFLDVTPIQWAEVDR
jgi:hypothetical protein